MQFVFSASSVIYVESNGKLFVSRNSQEFINSEQYESKWSERRGIIIFVMIITSIMTRCIFIYKI